MAPGERPVAVGTLAQELPATRWRRVRWRNGTNPSVFSLVAPGQPGARHELILPISDALH